MINSAKFAAPSMLEIIVLQKSGAIRKINPTVKMVTMTPIRNNKAVER